MNNKMSVVTYTLKKSTTTHNISTKSYQKSQPVEIKFIEHYISILKMLFNGNKNVNEIFKILQKQTVRIPYQSDKSTAIFAIDNLSKYKLITKTSVQRGRTRRKWIKNKNFKAQKIIIELTPIGKEVSQLIYYIHEYSQKYKKLKDVIDYHFNANDIGIKLVILHKRLKERGWQNQEIELYDQSMASILSLESHLPLVILNTLLARYFKIIYSYSSISSIVREILRRAIIDAITKFILDRLEGILADKILSGKPHSENAFSNTYHLLSGWTTSHFRNHAEKYSENRFIQNESLDLVRVLYNILDPPNNFLQNVLGREAKKNPKIDQLMRVLEASKDTS
jgi:hypothetical protein